MNKSFCKCHEYVILSPPKNLGLSSERLLCQDKRRQILFMTCQLWLGAFLVRIDALERYIMSRRKLILFPAHLRVSAVWRYGLVLLSAPVT